MAVHVGGRGAAHTCREQAGTWTRGLIGLWPVNGRVSSPTPAIRNTVLGTQLSSNYIRASRRLFVNNSLWTKTNVTATDDYATNWDGSSDASRIVGTGNWRLAPAYSNPVVPAGTHTAAVYAASNTGSNQSFAFTKDTSSTRSASQTATTSWQRSTYTFTLAAPTNLNAIGICSSDGTTGADIIISDLNLYLNSSVDLGAPGGDGHLYLGVPAPSTAPSYSSGVLNAGQGLIQLPSTVDLTTSGFTVQFCAEVTVAGGAYNSVLCDATGGSNLHFPTEGTLGPMGLSTSASISNQNGTGGGGGGGQVFQYRDLFEFVGKGVHVFTCRYTPSDTTYGAATGALEWWVDDIRMFRQERTWTKTVRDLIFGGINIGTVGNNKHSGSVAAWNRPLGNSEIRSAFYAQKQQAAADGVSITGDTTNRILVCEGDSISGGNGQACYTFRAGALGLLSPSILGTVWAITGSTLVDLNSRAARVKDVIPPSKLGRKFIYTFLIGANDLGSYPGATDAIAAAAYEAAMISVADTMRTAGYSVVVGTILPTSGGASTAHNARRAIINANIRANWLGVHCDGIADYAADPTMGTDAAAANLTYYSDGKHPTSTGYDILAGIYAPAVNAI